LKAMRFMLFNGVLLAILFFLPFGGELRAQDEEGQVAVQRVIFNRNASLTGDTRRWLETVVELNVSRPAGEDVFNPRYVDNIQIDLYISFDVSRGDVSRTRFYRSSVELPTLERGRHEIRFFLPPEVIGRDRITSEPSTYLVQLSVDGLRQELSSDARARILRRDEVLESFMRRVESEAGANDGILLPIHLTPFVNERQYFRDMPSIRRSNVR